MSCPATRIWFRRRCTGWTALFSFCLCCWTNKGRCFCSRSTDWQPFGSGRNLLRFPQAPISVVCRVRCTNSCCLFRLVSYNYGPAHRIQVNVVIGLRKMRYQIFQWYFRGHTSVIYVGWFYFTHTTLVI